jgi:DNA-binding NarL/FixJ family response regulator
MTAENCLRGSSEFGGIIGSMFGVKRLDEEKLKIHVECVKAREFEAPRPFQLEGRPHINSGRGLVMTAKPGECGYLKEEQKGKAKKIHHKQDAIARRIAEGKSSKEIEKELGVSSATVVKIRQMLKEAPVDSQYGLDLEY